jgi:Ankyrin repeat
MSLLHQALFMKDGALWEQIINGDAQELAEIMKTENQKTGQDNLLSESLFFRRRRDCDKNYVARISFIAENLSRVNEYDVGGFTPLMRAVQWGHLQVTEILLSRVPYDVNIDASMIDDTSLTVSDLALNIIHTGTPELNNLNKKVIEKCEWHALIYRPTITQIVQEMALNHLIQVLGDIILSFIFPKHKYVCLTASQKDNIEDTCLRAGNSHISSDSTGSGGQWDTLY